MAKRNLISSKNKIIADFSVLKKISKLKVYSKQEFKKNEKIFHIL